MHVSLRRRNKKKDILFLRKLELLKLEKMNGQNRSVSNNHHPHYEKERKCGEPIEWEETLNKNDNRIIELGEEEEGANTDDFICNSQDKDFEIESSLTSTGMMLAIIKEKTERIEKHLIRICDLRKRANTDDDFICNSQDKDFEIESSLTSIGMMLAIIKEKTERIEKHLIRLCDLRKLQMFVL
nr:MAG: hypothetical protein [Hemigrapsus takanoi nimavirus]